MLQKLKIKLLSLSAIVVASISLMLVPSVALAQGEVNIQTGVCTGANNLQIPPGGEATTDCNSIGGDNANNSVNNILREVINVFSVIVGIIAVIMIIVGGFRYITSGGQAEKITSAKNTILYALIGLVIVALAQVVVKFVLTKATSAGS